MSFISPIGQKKNKREREREKEKRQNNKQNRTKVLKENSTRVLSRKIVPAFKVQSTLP